MASGNVTQVKTGGTCNKVGATSEVELVSVNVNVAGGVIGVNG